MLTHSLSVIYSKAVQMHLTCGTILELGPGRVWPGLELLRREPDLDLLGLGYEEQERQEAVAQVRKNGQFARVQYRPGAPTRLPLPDRSVDGVISFGSLHTWSNPVRVLDEITRVLKIGGKVFIGDVRRDMNWLTSTVLSHIGNAGLQAVYRSREKSLTASEVKELCEHSRLRDWQVTILGSDVWLIAGG